MLLFRVLHVLMITTASSGLVFISLGLGSRGALGPFQPGLQVLGCSLEMPSGAAWGESCGCEQRPSQEPPFAQVATGCRS